LADEVLSESPDENYRFQVALLKGIIACEQNDLARARTALVEADKHNVTNAPLLAARERLAGNILLLERNPAEAAAAFDRAAALFQTAKHYRDMALALQRAGEAYQEAGDRQRAEDRLSRAKRSLAAQGQKTE
jgi:tetratricopeptide (TPR) repeat protein